MRKLLLAAAIGLGAMACTDRATENPDPGSNPQLPAITQTGANTFGAIINGKVMVPRNSIGYVPPGSNHYPVRYMSSPNYESVAAANGRDGSMPGIYFFIENDTNQSLPLGTYTIGEGDASYYPSYSTGIVMNSSTTIDNKVTMYISVANTGNITITRNDNQIISGTFSCKLKNKDNPSDILEVKDGRFDFTKATINTTNFP